MKAWDGLVATGEPDAGMARFPENASVEELIALAWSLEEGSRRFYSELQALLIDRDAVSLFHDLAIAEEHHRAILVDLHRKLTGTAAGFETPGEVMEGGMRISDALDWARGKKLPEVLDLAIGLETNSYDLYIKLGQRDSEVQTKELFSLLAASEKEHLARLAGLLDRKL